MRIPLEGLHTETGPGVLEAAIQYCEALEAADRGALFKTFTKILAQRNGMMATFMAKWSKDWPGQSGHVHTSLKRKSDGKAGVPRRRASLTTCRMRCAGTWAASRSSCPSC